MNTCPHFKDSRCLLAELLVLRELDDVVECPTSESQCDRCLARVPATEEKPTIQVISNAMAVLPPSKRPAWNAFWEFVSTGKPRGRGDKIAKITKATGIARMVKAVTKAVGIKDCGCARRQRRLNEQYPG